MIEISEGNSKAGEREERPKTAFKCFIIAGKKTDTEPELSAWRFG